jgi:hypothetical protein
MKIALLVPSLAALLIAVACAPAAVPSAAPTTAPKTVTTAVASPPAAAVPTIPASWQTANQLQGVTFRYPPEWRLRTNPDGVLVLEAPNEDQMGNGSMVIQLYPQTLPQFLASDNPSTGEKQDKQYPKTGDMTVGGRPARVTYGGCCGGSGRYVFVETPAGRTLSVGLYGDRAAPGMMRNEATYNQILSSIRFN